MNSECRSNSVHASPRSQQPRSTLSPSEYAAAGDAPRSQMSSDINSVKPTEIFAMDTLLLTTPMKNTNREKGRSNDSSAYPNVPRIRSCSDDPLANGASMIDTSRIISMNNAKLIQKADDKESRFTSETHARENHLSSHISLETEPPCKEYSYKIERTSRKKDFFDTLENSELSKIITKTETRDLRSNHENYSVEEILSPDRKISMFANEIWTEKILPIDTFICPEPEVVKICFDKKKMTNQSKRFEDYSTESVDVSTTNRGNKRCVLGRNISSNPPLAVRKGRLSSSGDRTINFDNEIWPVCPKLILDGEESRMCVFGNKPESIPPEKLNKDSEDTNTIIHPPCSSLKIANIFGVSSWSNTKEFNDLGNNNSKIEKVIEPTHEIEGQTDHILVSETRKFRDNEYSKSKVKVVVADKADSIFCEPNPVIDIQQRTNLSKSKPLSEVRISQPMIQISSGKQDVKIGFEASQTRAFNKNALSLSNSEPVSTVLKGISNRRETDSFHKVKSPMTSSSEIISLANLNAKKKIHREHPISEIVQHDSFSSVKNKDVTHDHSEDTVCASISTALKRSREIQNRSTIPPSKLPIPESKVIKSVDPQEIENTHKCVKVVRFKPCGSYDTTEYNETGMKRQGHFEIHQNTRQRRKVHSEYLSVESFEQEIDQLANQITRQVKADSVLDDAVVALAKIELIVEANRQTFERLQQLQPNLVIPRVIPSGAGKSISKALLRCRNYMQDNGYSTEATGTLNKLLTSTVKKLKQLVEKQKIALAIRGGKRFAMPGGQRQSKKSDRETSANTEEALIIEEFGMNQMKILISDILELTENISPKLNELEYKKKIYFHKSKSSTKNRTAIIEQQDDFPEDWRVTLEDHTIKGSQSVDVSKSNKTNKAIKITLETPTISSNPAIGSNEIRGDHEVDENLVTAELPIAPPTHPKKIVTTDSTKTLKKLFDELREKRSKPLPRHCYNVNDFSNNFRSLGSSNVPINNHKLPVWKPGGNNLVRSSTSTFSNNQKIRPPLASSANKKKNTAIDYNRDITTRTKTTPGIVKNTSKTSEKYIIKPYNTMSLAKIRTVPTRGHHSELLYLDRSKVQVNAEIDETKSRKPRSKSRTRTRIPNNISRMTVTEIPLEHANNTLAAEELPLTKKALSSPRDIIQMLEELIKTSDNKTSIQNVSPLQIVGRCDIAVTDAKENVDPCSTPFVTDVKLMDEIDVAFSNERGDHSIEESCENQVIQTKAFGNIDRESKNTTEINRNEIQISKENASAQNTLMHPYNLDKEHKSISFSNVEEIVTISTSNSEVISNRSTEEQATPSVSNIIYTKKESSENSIGSMFSKCCQVSWTSVTSHEISDELISSHISDTGLIPCGEETQKNSNESFDTIEDEEITREDSSLQFQNDRNASTSNDAAPKKKYFNRHAKSLEMLKEILSDQGLGIHLLSRAENDVRDRCKCSSNRRRLTMKRSLQGENFCTDSKFSDESINEVLLPDRNLSTSLFSKLATLSESESDIKHMEIATMTSVDIATLVPHDLSISLESHGQCSKEDELLSSKIVMVENATQFDIIPKSDMCVGDEIICKSDVFVVAGIEDKCTEKLDTLKSSSLSHEMFLPDHNKPSESKLPNDILDAFRLATVRANNLHAAFNILRQNIPLENEMVLNLDSNNMLTHTPIPDSLTTDTNSLHTHELKSSRVQHSSKGFNIDTSVNSPVNSNKSKFAQSRRMITPKIQEEVNNNAKFSETTKSAKKKNCHTSSLDQRKEKKEIETLHFARRQTDSLFKNATNARSNNIIEFKPESMRVDFADYAPANVGGKVKDLVAGSRIKSLLEENLQRFNTDHNPTIHHAFFTNHGDQCLTESSDDEVLITRKFAETTTTSTSCMYNVDDYTTFSEVKNLVDCLLNEIEEYCESSIMVKQHDLNTQSPRRCHLQKRVRRLKLEKTKKKYKHSIVCNKYEDNLCQPIVYRERLLFLIYAAICSFVFCCLQLSVYCEV